MIDDLIVEVHQLLTQLEIRHAFGGALALNYYAEPRGTNDVDVNVSVSFEDIAELIGEFERRGFASETPIDTGPPSAGIRLRRGLDVIDVFSTFDDFHLRVIEHAVQYPFKASKDRIELPFLSANDLVVFKLSFNRSKDWADVDALLAAGTPIDVAYVEENLVSLRGKSMYPRIAALRSRIAEQL